MSTTEPLPAAPLSASSVSGSAPDPRRFDGNRVTTHTGAAYPIFQAPIGLISRADLVGAVTVGGGIGLLETASLPLDELNAEFEKVRERTARPFGLHLMIPILSRRPDQEREVLDWALDGRVQFITTGYGDPGRYIDRIRAAGVVTYHWTDSLDEALRAQDLGVNGVILAGAERGGGHHPDGLHTMALLQRARGRFDVPIVATGGIVDGYGMAAAFALGAEGVWMGTRFISSAECPWHINYKQSIVDTDHVISIDMSLPFIPSMRAVKNDFAEAVARGEAGHKRNPYAGDALSLFYEGRTDAALVGCGESAVLIDEVKPAAQIVHDTVREFWSVVDRLAELGRSPAPS